MGSVGRAGSALGPPGEGIERALMPTVALVNASARMDGISNAARNIQRAFRELVYGVVWYQCVDRGQDSQISEMDRIIPGLGFPNDTVDMGINRLWVFAHRLRHVPEETVLLMDPTLVNVAPVPPSHRRSGLRP